MSHSTDDLKIIRSVKGRPCPPSPTTAAPGSKEKIAIMAERYAEGYHIHHPDDCVDYSVFAAIAHRLESMTSKACEHPLTPYLNPDSDQDSV